jgi:hypothetical protein
MSAFQQSPAFFVVFVALPTHVGFFLVSTRHYFSYNYKGFSAGVNPVWMLQRLCEAAPTIALLNNNINIITIKRFQTTAYCGIKRLHRPLLHARLVSRRQRECVLETRY